jgi:hypothetical protein
MRNVYGELPVLHTSFLAGWRAAENAPTRHSLILCEEITVTEGEYEQPGTIGQKFL